MEYYILLDVGGTGIKAGYANENKMINDTIWTFPSKSDGNKEEIIRNFAEIIEFVYNNINSQNKIIKDIRFAFPGPFDYNNGISYIKGLSKYESIYGVNLAVELCGFAMSNNIVCMPKNIDSYKFINDVSAFALGISHNYYLLNNTRSVYLCIGTGAGSAFTINGKITDDENQGTPQNGWIYKEKFRDSIIDDYISIRGIAKLSLAKKGIILSPKELSELACTGDEKAIEIYREFGENLSDALMDFVIRFKATHVVIGGNISKSANLFKHKILTQCEALGVKLIFEENTSKMSLIGLSQI